GQIGRKRSDSVVPALTQHISIHSRKSHRAAAHCRRAPLPTLAPWRNESVTYRQTGESGGCGRRRWPAQVVRTGRGRARRELYGGSGGGVRSVGAERR